MNDNYAQKNAIESINGPILVIAGPGTGKTFTLVERVKYMVSEKGIDPSKILISTFTNKASFELVDRLNMIFKKNDIKKDVNEMIVGNFHSICRNINDEYLEYTNLKKGYMQLDDTAQKYLIYRNISKFRSIPNYSQLVYRQREVKDIVSIVNMLREEAIIDDGKSNDIVKNTALEILRTYEDILEKMNMIDFSGILYTSYKLLLNNKDVRDSLRNKIQYMMIDEYQDTNTIQEKIIFLLLNNNNNICVVGDDDQSLYRFRGASSRNLFNFRERFENVKVIKLMQNYRSEDSIIKFYSKYLSEKINKNEKMKKFRYDKILFSDKTQEEKRVLRIYEQDAESWRIKIYQTIKELKDKGKINSYNEIAILFSSINTDEAIGLRRYLQKKGINIYLPKTNTLLSKDHVKDMISVIYAIFKEEIDKSKSLYFDSDTYEFIKINYDKFYKKMLKNKNLEEYVLRLSNYIKEEKFGFTLFDIYYRLFAYNPFYEYMKNESKAKDLSRFLELIETFNIINGIHYINKKNKNLFIEYFFTNFVAFIKNEKITEFDEETIIPDENTLSFMTIHSSKGMEYPVVIMGSLWDYIYENRKSKIQSLIERFSETRNWEPLEIRNQLDFYRKYYTGFSRAKDLLILSGYKNNTRRVSDEFYDLIEELSDINVDKLKLKPQEKKKIKIKKSYSYTTDILPYLKSPMEYFYTRKLKFIQPKTKSLYLGSIVHESIESINKTIIKGEKVENIDSLVTEIARNKFIQGAFMLKKEDVDEAISAVKKYFENIQNMGTPVDSELSIIYSFEDFVIKGNVDMVFENNSNINICDFKTGLPDNKSIENYFNQINLYSYLYEHTKNKEIENLYLYFTDEKILDNILIRKKSQEKIDDLIEKIKIVINNIENENFNFDNDISEKYDGTKSLLRFFFDKYYEECLTIN